MVFHNSYTITFTFTGAPVCWWHSAIWVLPNAHRPKVSPLDL